MRKAQYWIVKEKESKEVQCLLCPHTCRIPEGERGLCRIRYNKRGELVLSNYGQITAAALDPLEKKPLKEFLPGKMVFSIGTFGCNLACGFCQNWQIAHGEAPSSQYYDPEEAVEQAKKLVPYGNIGIAYTYSEPLMWYEYVLDTARLVREAGLKNILVTNGYVNPKPLRKLLPYIDAVNLDIKAFTDTFYQDVCSGRLKPVLTSARMFAENCHLEITTLLVPGLNDSVEEVRKLAQWIAEVDSAIPLHLTRYFPNYKFEQPATSPEIIKRAKKVASEYLTSVYMGNI